MRKQNVSFFYLSYALRHDYSHNDPGSVPDIVAVCRLVGQQANL
jgi:hypothetical protein